MSNASAASGGRRIAVWHHAMPRPVRVVLVVLAAVVVGLAIHGVVTSLTGNDEQAAFDGWLSSGAEWIVAALCALGALRSERNRVAWLLVSVAIALWALGDTIWTLRASSVASVTISDAFWLAWYPLIVAALVLLVRDRVPVFELHRWIDGIVVMLVIVTPWVAIFLQPAAEHSSASSLVDTVDFAYPLGDAIVVGAALGVLALMGWRLRPMWIALVLGFTALGVADAVYSLDALGHTYSADTVFDALWLGGMLVIAYAAWLPHPGDLEHREVYGWRAIALPLAAQCFAVALQIYGVFFTVPIAERVLTIAVLLIAIVQIVVTRPRAPSASESDDADADRAGIAPGS